MSRTKNLAIVLTMVGSMVGTVGIARTHGMRSEAAGVCRSVVADLRARFPKSSDRPRFEAVDIGPTRYVVSTRNSRIVRKSRGAGANAGFLGHWVEVKVAPLNAKMGEMAEGDRRLMHLSRGTWHFVAATDEANPYDLKDLKRGHVPASVIRGLHLR